MQAGPHTLSEQAWLDAALVVVLGGPIGVADIDSHSWLGDEIAGIRPRLGPRRPLLGLCLGSQLMAVALGARVAPLPNKEIGWAPIALTAEAAYSPPRHLADLEVLHWHGDAFDLPPEATLLASTPMTPHQAFSVGASALAMQFHAEVDASKIEPLLIGHTAKLRATSVDTSQLWESSACSARHTETGCHRFAARVAERCRLGRPLCLAGSARYESFGGRALRRPNARCKGVVDFGRVQMDEQRLPPRPS